MLETIAGANGGRRPSTKTRRLVDAVGLSCSLGYAALAFVARPPGEPDLVAFFSLMAWTGLPVFGLFLYCQRRDEAVPLDRLLFWAVAFRICGLVGGPLLEDDFYRYLWDGYRFATTGTPYAAVPEAFFTDPTVPAAFHSRAGRDQPSRVADHLRPDNAVRLPAGLLAAARQHRGFAVFAECR